MPLWDPLPGLGLASPCIREVERLNWEEALQTKVPSSSLLPIPWLEENSPLCNLSPVRPGLTWNNLEKEFPSHPSLLLRSFCSLGHGLKNEGYRGCRRGQQPSSCQVLNPEVIQKPSSLSHSLFSSSSYLLNYPSNPFVSHFSLLPSSPSKVILFQWTTKSLILDTSSQLFFSSVHSLHLTSLPASTSEHWPWWLAFYSLSVLWLLWLQELCTCYSLCLKSPVFSHLFN